MKRNTPSKERIFRFMHKPWQEKAFSLQIKFKPIWDHVFPFVPFPIRLPSGSWWLAGGDTCSDAILANSFEWDEWHFVKGFLKEGMTVLDIGAHHGFYTILAAKKVGAEGQVIAFEPSPRERRRLRSNLLINRCKKVKVEAYALASQEGEAAFFLVDGKETVLNSLRRPAISADTKMIFVNTIGLDRYLEKENIQTVDFIKIDAEGAELEIINGAQKSLRETIRPIVMIEVSDLRTQPWGYRASTIHEKLIAWKYCWFMFTSGGGLYPYANESAPYNYLAIPEEKLDLFREIFSSGAPPH